MTLNEIQALAKAKVAEKELLEKQNLLEQAKKNQERIDINKEYARTVGYQQIMLSIEIAANEGKFEERVETDSREAQAIIYEMLKNEGYKVDLDTVIEKEQHCGDIGFYGGGTYFYLKVSWK